MDVLPCSAVLPQAQHYAALPAEAQEQHTHTSIPSLQVRSLPAALLGTAQPSQGDTAAIPTWRAPTH